MEASFYVAMIDFGPVDSQHILAGHLGSEMLHESYRNFMESRGRSGAVLKAQAAAVEGSVVVSYVIPGINMNEIEQLNEEFMEFTISEWKIQKNNSQLQRIAKFSASKLKQIDLNLINSGREHHDRCWITLGEGCTSNTSITDRFFDPKTLLSIHQLTLHHLQSSSGRFAIEYSSQNLGPLTELGRGFGDLRPSVITVKDGIVPK